MKAIFYTFFMLLFISWQHAHSQSNITLIKGIQNQVEIGELADTSRYSYVCSACEISWKRSSGQVVPAGSILLRPNVNASSISLLIRLKETKQPVKTINFRLSNQPDMVLMLDDVRIGEKLTVEPSIINMGYPRYLGLNQQAVVRAWELSIPGAKGAAGRCFSGNSVNLSKEAAQAIINTPVGASFSFIVAYVNPDDGIQRKYAGVWKME